MLYRLPLKLLDRFVLSCSIQVMFRRVAQLVEHRSPKPGVVGSSPAAPAILLMVVLTACTSVQSFAECAQHSSALITDQYCELNGTRFINPEFSPQVQAPSSQQQSAIPSVVSSSIHSSQPAGVRLQVPFTPQAPTANWEHPFDEACEEVSYLMVEYMLQGKVFTPELAEQEIADFVQYQTERGYAVDITLQELAELVEQKYGRTTTVFTGSEVTVAKIESLLAEGYPVIIPAAGQLLGNPYFSGDGPPYHALVITGYDQHNFITNDPGTKRGEGFTYNKEHLVSVIHNWTGSVSTITTGEPALMIVYR